MSEGIIDCAAEMLALGIDPLRFLYTTDDLERQLLLEIRTRAVEYKKITDHNLAVSIAQQVGKLFG